MFTVEQIKEAYSSVKSGADFPKYAQDIKQLGVTGFETWVADSHTVYFGKDGYQTTSAPMYENLIIEDNVDKEKFNHQLHLHQQGKTDYLTFCNDCAETGIEKWFVSLQAMNCIYYDKQGNEILVEEIPE